MWVLVFLVVQGNTIKTDILGRYDYMASCFEAREATLVDLKAFDGYLPINTQIVCVRTE